jgi:DNA-binding XRE family transcriptional regulator
MPKRLKFRAYRIAAGYKTQADFAQVLGITKCAISNIESGKMRTTPRLSTLRKMMDAFGLPFEEIIKLFND